MHTAKPLFFIDSHEDIAWNILTFGRDYSDDVLVMRSKEAGRIAPEVNGDTLVGLDTYRAINTLAIIATLFTAPRRHKEGPWDRITYANSSEAYTQIWQQLDAYHRLVDDHPESYCLIKTSAELQAHTDSFLRAHAEGRTVPIALILLLEGADGIRTPDDLRPLSDEGLRMIDLAWVGTRYSGGTSEPGPLTDEGLRLLKEMRGLNYSLDVSHMDEKSVLEAFRAFDGRVLASHTNPLSMLQARNSNRHASDAVIREIHDRSGVIGLIPYNLFLEPSWQKGDPKDSVSISRYVEQIDTVCQLLGESGSVGIGTDFGGGFGCQSVPKEIDRISDLRKLVLLLQDKGYSDKDIAGIFGQNWLRFLLEILG